MATEFEGALGQAVMITAFVAVMMIAVEYLSVVTRGAFQRALTRARWMQYLASVALGAIPGCLGAFTVVTLYAHRVVSLGAVVGAMIATSGDEAFVMFAMFPTTALWLTLGLMAVGLVAAPIVDAVAGRPPEAEACVNLVVHAEDACRCFPGWEIVAQWRRPSGGRVALTVGMTTFAILVVVGVVGPAEWNWVRVTLIVAAAFGTFVVSTVPDHFLRKHLWEHVTLRHVPRVFAWTLGVLVLVTVAGRWFNLGTLVQRNPAATLGLGALTGIIPESGPNLIFVTWFAKAQIPLSVLVTNSIVQDGHGMLPLLADSRKDFIIVKAINLVAGLAVGGVMLSLGH